MDTNLVQAQHSGLGGCQLISPTALLQASRETIHLCSLLSPLLLQLDFWIGSYFLLQQCDLALYIRWAAPEATPLPGEHPALSALSGKRLCPNSPRFFLWTAFQPKHLLVSIPPPFCIFHTTLKLLSSTGLFSLFFYQSLILLKSKVLSSLHPQHTISTGAQKKVNQTL